MDAHRLRSVLDLILAEHARLEIEKKLARIAGSLGACVKSPSAAHDNKFRSALDALLAACRASRTNDLVESGRRVLTTIGGHELTGLGLAARVEAIVDEQPFLPARAKDRFVKLGEALADSIETISTAMKSLRRLNVGGEPVERDGEDARRGDYELGIILPDTYVKGHLVRVGAELKEWDEFLDDFLPAVAGRSSEVTLRAYTAGTFELSVGLDDKGAHALGTVLGELYDIFRKVTANRTTHEDLETRRYPPEIIARVKDYEKQLVNGGLAAIKSAVLSGFVRPDAGGRRRDIDRTLDRGLRFLMRRINEGVDLEIVGPPPARDQQDAVATWGDDRLKALPHHVRGAMAIASGAQKAAPVDERAAHMRLSQIAADSRPKAA